MAQLIFATVVVNRTEEDKVDIRPHLLTVSIPPHMVVTEDEAFKYAEDQFRCTSEYQDGWRIASETYRCLPVYRQTVRDWLPYLEDRPSEKRWKQPQLHTIPSNHEGQKGS